MSDILRTEYSEQFDKERKHRIEVSYFKYGPAKKNFAEGRVDAMMQTGELMSPMLKECSQAGLAKTKTAIKIEKDLKNLNKEK